MKLTTIKESRVVLELSKNEADLIMNFLINLDYNTIDKVMKDEFDRDTKEKVDLLLSDIYSELYEMDGCEQN